MHSGSSMGCTVCLDVSVHSMYQCNWELTETVYHSHAIYLILRRPAHIIWELANCSYLKVAKLTVLLLLCSTVALGVSASRVEHFPEGSIDFFGDHKASEWREEMVVFILIFCTDSLKRQVALFKPRWF